MYIQVNLGAKFEMMTKFSTSGAYDNSIAVGVMVVDVVVGRDGKKII